MVKRSRKYEGLLWRRTLKVIKVIVIKVIKSFVLELKKRKAINKFSGRRPAGSYGK